MSGFEHQVAAHMMAEGMIDESLVLTRHIHDRHHATKRNPFNEIECSDHYARAMASYGSFISACGFEYHGPKGYIAFAPKWNKENFKAAFTAAEGWGTYLQKLQGKKQVYTLDLKYGSLKLNTTRLQKLNNDPANSVAVTIGQQPIPASINQTGAGILITYSKECLINAGESLTIIIA
jgi:non-lysosomal glucosylceramidase